MVKESAEKGGIFVVEDEQVILHSKPVVYRNLYPPVLLVPIRTGFFMSELVVRKDSHS